MTRRQGFEKLEEEIVREKAAALGRAGERLQSALDEARALGAALDAEPEATRRQELLRAYDAARRQAAAARLMLLVQREAIGLRWHRDVDRQFPEPPRRS